jgi:chitinase
MKEDTKAMAAKLVTLEVGKTRIFTVTGKGSKISWSSSKKSVATVSSKGIVTGKSPGTATIYASVGGKKYSSKVTVKYPIKLSNTSFTLQKGLTKTLKVTGTTSKVTWSTSKKSVATVSTKGKVTAKAPGTATIYASVGSKKLSSKVTVKEVPGIGSKTQTPQDITSPGATPEPELSPINTAPTDPDTSTKVVGYYAAWAKYSGFTPDNVDANKLTHINYAFANISSDLKISLGYPDIDAANIKQLNLLKKINPKLKTIIAVGGWSWSGRFSDAASTQNSRETFANSVVDFILKYGFDGVDIDWEYPVSGGLVTNTRRPEDKYNFTLLMKTLREKLDARGAIDGKHYVLSFAGAAGSWYANNTQLGELSKYVDYANVMTYDIHGTWDSQTDFNAPLYSDSATYQSVSVDTSIHSWLKAGFAKNKIVMGVPFYGYIYKAVDNNNNGLNQTYSGGASISYANIAANYLNTPEYTRYYHAIARVPWLFNGSTFITYEDEQSMAEKAKYIKDNGLSGAMIWELSQDPNRKLLNALYQGLR